MTDLPSMNELIARLKAATGPDRESDRDIAEAIGWQRKVVSESDDDYWKWGDWSWTMEDSDHPPRYTASIDAALTLVPEGKYWVIGQGKTRPDEPLGGAEILEGADHVISEAEHESVIIAICIAALKARGR